MKPYLKHMFEQASNTGRPPMRPLFFDFPQDQMVVNIQDQYMFGDDLMVAPVLKYQQRYRTVYFPGTSATKWVNFWDDKEIHYGGTLKNLSVPLNTILVFRKPA